MKAIFVVLALVLCVFADGGKFTPYKLPCAFKIDYNSTYKAEDGSTAFLKSWTAKYGRYLAEYGIGTVMGSTRELYSVCRVDIHSPDNANTAAVFFGMGINGQKLCELEEYNPLDHPYHEMGENYEWFTQDFEYDSTNADAEYKGIKCKSYTKGDIIIYADDQNKIIAIQDGKDQVFDGIVYNENAQDQHFRMPKSFPGCEDKVYKSVEKEKDCDLAPDTASFSGVSVFVIAFAMLVSLLVMF